MRVIISYDIRDNKYRNRLSKTLEGYAERVQKSVFEGEMSPQQYRRLRDRLSKIRLSERDSIRYYVLCEACGQKIHIEGAGKVVRAPNHFII